MTRIARLRAFLPSLVVLLCSCGLGVTIVRQASPNPMSGRKSFSVAPVDFSKVQYGNPGRYAEEAYLEKNLKKDKSLDEARAALQKGKELFGQSFGNGVMYHGRNKGHFEVNTKEIVPDSFVIKAVVTDLEPGFAATITAAPCVAKATITIEDPTGKEVDVFEVKGSNVHDAYAFSYDKRVGPCGDPLGAAVGKYLAERIK
ncbi:MAG TPA: hypothetical protein VGK67_08755 [Myxococcales bacterium]|jgi:hypothetical protein